MSGGRASMTVATSWSNRKPCPVVSQRRVLRATMLVMSTVGVSRDGHVVVVEIQQGPHNFASTDVMNELADALEAATADGARAALLCSEGKSFCAGAQFSGSEGQRAGNFGAFVQSDNASPIGPFYESAMRLYNVTIPIVAAVHGPAVGAGFGLATACDLRVICAEAFMATNFVRLGIHPGFGISVTLPELIGPARAADVLLTGRRIYGEEAFQLGLANRLVAQAEVRPTALALAHEMASAAPLAVQATRATLRTGLAERVRERLLHERLTQDRLSATADAEEGIASMLARRDPVFTGR
jgi:enoyl-CoA hydratase/carnithine racemase